MNSYNGFTPEQRMKALYWLKAQVKAGTRTAPTECMACGQKEGVIEAHSEDYSEPFGDHIGAYAFCYRCHMMIHCRFRSPEAWNSYRLQVRNGTVFAACYTRNFQKIVSYLTMSEVLIQRRQASRERTVLDDIHDANRLQTKTERKPKKPIAVTLSLF